MFQAITIIVSIRRYRVVTRLSSSYRDYKFKLQNKTGYILQYFSPEHATSNTVDAGLQTDPTALWAAVGVAVAGLVGVLLGVLFVHRGFNRKKMLLTSSVGITITFTALGAYLLLQTGGNNEILPIHFIPL